jgi:hypothetical protein
MTRKGINNKYFMLLTLIAFCLSSATLSGLLLYESELHFDHYNIHLHHTDEDHSLGESDHRDANIILYLNYVGVNSSNSVKTLSVLNPCLHSYHSPNYFCNLFNSFSSITHYSNKNRFCTHNLYQLNSSYLI